MYNFWYHKINTLEVQFNKGEIIDRVSRKMGSEFCGSKKPHDALAILNNSSQSQGQSDPYDRRTYNGMEGKIMQQRTGVNNAQRLE